MQIELLTKFLTWCTILNVGLLVFSALFIMYASDFVYRVHSKLFPMSREVSNVVLYSLLGAYKIIVIAFNVVPWAALAIIG